MSTEKSSKRRLKKPETVRERAEKATVERKPRRLQRTASSVKRPFTKARRLGQKEYYLPLPDNRLGRFLNKRRKFLPRYFRDAWTELRQVQWPTNRETWKLALAVFIFAISFGVVIAITDYGLTKLFREVLIK